MTGHHFISYSAADGREFARRLADALLSGPPSTPVWVFERHLEPGRDWDAQLAEANAAAPRSPRPSRICRTATRVTLHVILRRAARKNLCAG